MKKTFLHICGKMVRNKFGRVVLCIFGGWAGPLGIIIQSLLIIQLWLMYELL